MRRMSHDKRRFQLRREAVAQLRGIAETMNNADDREKLEACANEIEAAAELLEQEVYSCAKAQYPRRPQV